MTTIDVSNAPTVFATMSGVGDNGTRYAPGKNQPGKCTRWNWLAVGGGAGFSNSTPLPSAVAAWNNAPAEHRHPLSQRPFRGAIGVFGATSGPRWAGDVNYPYGDVVMFTGDGLASADWRDWMTVATDADGVGAISVVSLAKRQPETGNRPLLGWLSSYGGAELVYGTTPAPTPTPAPQEDDMAISDEVLVMQTQYSKNPAVLDTWLVFPATGTYRHCPSDQTAQGWAALGARVISGAQPRQYLAGFACTDTSGGVR